MHILSRAKRAEEREFYLRMTVQQCWQVREVARQIDSGLFGQAVLNPPNLLFLHRGLNCLVAIELKVAAFANFSGSVLPFNTPTDWTSRA